MGTVTIEELNKLELKKKFTPFSAGQTVRVHQKIKEGDKERIQIFQGLIIETTGGHGVNGSITVRKVVDGIGVEKVFPIHSPFIEKIELVKEAKVRRSRIFFMRGRSGKSARLQERFYSESELESMKPHEVTEAEVEEAILHQKEEEAKLAEVEGKGSEEAPTEEIVQKKTSPEEVSPEKEEAEAK
ncbi:50S ribosomal protein L19 [Candidatus Peregrinibacteria bacterium]|nr:50S ribosomal protein L19 [Candidatus Peregrinibacteria bacterium]